MPQDESLYIREGSLVDGFMASLLRVVGEADFLSQGSHLPLLTLASLLKPYSIQKDKLLLLIRGTKMDLRPQ